MTTKTVEEVRIKVAEELQKKWLDPNEIKGWLANSKDRKIPREAQEQIAEVIRSLFAEYGLRPDLGHVVVLGDRPYVTREGLLYYARKSGNLKGIKVEIVEKGEEACLVKATVYTKDDGEFEAFGDADIRNTNRMVSPHLIRMAETRAINRALREAFPIGLCSYEELAESDVIYNPETGEVVDTTDDKPITNAQRKKIIAEAQRIYGDEWKKQVHALMQVMFNKESSKELTREEASELIEHLIKIEIPGEKPTANTETKEELFGGAND